MMLESVEQLVESPVDESWWVELEAELDRADVLLTARVIDDAKVQRALEEAVTAFTQYAPPSSRVTNFGVKVVGRLGLLRETVQHSRGNPGMVPTIRVEAAHVVKAAQLYDRRTRIAFWESATRDVGGEV